MTRACLGMRWGMLSFQPAAFVGNPSRWKEDFAAVTMDDVWGEIERGVGTRLPWEHLQMGDPRCNRSAYGVLAGGRWTPLLDDRDRATCASATASSITSAGWTSSDPRSRSPWRWRASSPAGPPWSPRRPAGPPASSAAPASAACSPGGPRGLTFVVHAFMDAAVVRPAWEAMERGEIADGSERPGGAGAPRQLLLCDGAPRVRPPRPRLRPALGPRPRGEPEAAAGVVAESGGGRRE